MLILLFSGYVMAFIKALKLENLRSLKDTGYIKIKPITILVGKNSVGKSTFLRTFPLLRQSSEREKKAPILWYGNLTDFGDFNTALNRNADQKHIGFSFALDLSDLKDDIDLALDIKKESNNEIKVCFRIQGDNKSSFASELELCFLDQKIKYIFNNQQEVEELNVNTHIYSKDYLKEKGLEFKVIQSDILPFPRLLTKIKKDKVEFLRPSNFFEQQLAQSLQNLCIRKVNEKTIERIIAGIPFSVNEKIYEYLINQKFSVGLSTKLKTKEIHSSEFKKIVDLYFLSKLHYLIFVIDMGLSNSFRSVRYLEPLRATAQRYYRRQELAIDEIDSKGSNIAMFLDSLSTSEKNSLSELLIKHFNIEANARNTGGHLTLTIKHPDLKEETNIADLGVGYSQLLPFVIQLWDSVNRRSRTKHFNYLPTGRRQKYFVVEQPELHLHPAYQAKIADLICSILDKEKLNLILETHSSHLIFRLGELIEEKILDKNDVQILIFEEKEGCSEIRHAEFDDEGRLLNWPIGFFQP